MVWANQRVWGALCLVLFACKADSTGPATDDSDAAVDAVLQAPVLSNIVETTPRATVAIRGTSGGDRVAILGGPGGTSLASILPGGNFCADVEVAAGTETQLTVYSMGDGLLSEPIQLAVTNDAAAPEPASPTCSGTTEPNCEQPEICDNEEDDNCDGYSDLCDQSCSGCIDDALEPNDFLINVPSIEAGSYELKLCPCRDDWFAFDVNVGQRIRATSDFDHDVMNLNMRLYKATPGGEQGAFAQGSFTTTDQESIDYSAEEAGLYFMRIYILGTAGEQQGSYTLTVP
jgi:hypothetical protein